MKLEDYITIEHIESMNKVIVATGMIVGVAYLTELFISWYSGYVYEQFAFFNRALGPYYWSYFGMMFCNVISPLFFFSKKLRRNIAFTFFMSILINIGMWFERFVIIATTLARDYLPSSWSFYVPTWVEIGIYLGTFGLFFTCYLIFVRVAPVVAIAEIKSILKSSGDQYAGGKVQHSPMSTAAPVKPEMVSSAGKIIADDLKKIEGIGPKVEAALNDAGIHTFEQLAAASAGRLQSILDNADGNFRGNSPESWASQAAIAHKGDWDALKKLQDDLDGGRY